MIKKAVAKFIPKAAKGGRSAASRIVHRKDYTIRLKPRVLQDVPVSARTLRGMDEAMKNLSAGKRSKPADLKKYARFAK